MVWSSSLVTLGALIARSEGVLLGRLMYIEFPPCIQDELNKIENESKDISSQNVVLVSHFCENKKISKNSPFHKHEFQKPDGFGVSTINRICEAIKK